MKRYKTVIGLFIAIILIFSLYGFAARRNAARKIENVKISFANLYEPIISEQTVNKLLIQNPADFQNAALENLDLKKSEQKLRNHPMVRAADVSLTVDGKIEITVEAKKPIARIMSVPNRYLDTDNSLMPLSSEFSVLVPLVYGYKDAYKNDAFKLVSAIRNDKLLNASVTEIKFNKNGEVILAVRAYDYEVILGQVTDLDDKLNNYKAFIAKMIKDNSLEVLKTIDLRYKGQVVVVKKG